MKNKDEYLFYWLTKCLFLFVFVVLFNAYFWVHYNGLLIPVMNILKSMIIINVSFIVAISSVIAYKNFINPVSLYSLFIFLTGYSYITISEKQHSSYSLMTEIVLFLTILSFLTGCFFNRRVYRIKFKPLTKGAVRVFFMVILILSIIVFALEVLQIGYIPILNLSSDIDVYSETNEVLIPFAHYLVLFMALVPSIAYAFYKAEKVNKLMFIIISAIGFFIILNFLSRQIIMLLMLSLFYSYLYFNRVSLTRTFSIGIVIIAMFIIVGNLRAGSSEVVGGVNEYLKGYAQIDKDVSLLETYLTLYSSQNFTTLDRLVTEISNNSKIGFGIYSFKPIISLLMLDRVGLIYYDPQYDGFKSLGTYALDPFLDFSLPGVVLINFLYGFLCMNTFRSFSERRNAQAIINWSLLSFCIIMSSFTNFYDTFFIWFAILLSIPLSNYKHKSPNDLSLPGHT